MRAQGRHGLYVIMERESAQNSRENCAKVRMRRIYESASNSRIMKLGYHKTHELPVMGVVVCFPQTSAIHMPFYQYFLLSCLLLVISLVKG